MDAIMLLIQESRRYFYIFCCGTLLTACAEYSFNINDNEIYSPPRLFSDFSTTDPGLQDCLEQTISDARITSAEQLETLVCSNAGIESIEGINQFSRLTRLNLKGNKIQNIDELLQLTYLEELDISDNPIPSCQTLSQLQAIVTGQIVHSGSCR